MDPRDEEEVRRLLAAAAEPASMPTDVSARLTDVIGRLQAEREGTGHRSPASATAPVDLATRRRRRWPTVLVAAAAVAAIAAGLGNFVQGSTGSSESATSAEAPAQAGNQVGGQVDSQGDGQAETGREATQDGAAPSAVAPPDTGVEGKVRSRTQLLEAPTSSLPGVRTESARGDVQRIYDLSLAALADGNRRGLSGSPAPECALPPVGRGERAVAVRLDGGRATLLFGARRDGGRQAEVFRCDDPGSPVIVTRVRTP